MKRLLSGLFVATICTFSVFAQHVQPKEPEIVLPPVLLQVQDVTKEKIDTPLPEEQAPVLPEFNIALPKAQNINLGTAAYKVPIPTEGPGGAPISPTAKPTASFFSDGLIGAGSMNHIVGDVTLYKLGSNPRFNLEFSHERLDGYLSPSTTSPFHFEQSGAGFFNQTDALTGNLTYSTNNLFNFETHDYYRQTQNGLQGLGTYNSVDHRFIFGGVKGEYTHIAPFSFGSNIDASIGDMTLTGLAPINSDELSVTPSLNVGVNLKNVTGTLSGFYGLTQSTEQPLPRYQKAGGTLSVNANLPRALTLDGKVGVQWDTSIGWVLPFSLELDGLYKDLLQYRVYGGHRVIRPSYFSLWGKYPYLTYSVPLITSMEWYGGFTDSWRFTRTFALDSGVDFTQATEEILPTSLAANGTGLFDFSQGASTILGPSIGLSWNPTGPLSMSVGWTGHFFDSNQFAPVSSFNLNAEFDAASGRYGGAFTGIMDLLRTSPGSSKVSPEMPNLKLSGYFRVSDGVTFHLDLNDLLSPLMDNSGGRKTWDVYTDPGFRVTVTTQISL